MRILKQRRQHGGAAPVRAAVLRCTYDHFLHEAHDIIQACSQKLQVQCKLHSKLNKAVLLMQHEAAALIQQVEEDLHREEPPERTCIQGDVSQPY